MCLICLDSVSLIKSALDDKEYGWLKQSAAAEQVWRTTMKMMTVLADTFLPGGVPEGSEPDKVTIKLWRKRYFAAVRRLRQANIKIIEDEETGVQTYVALRAKWDRFIRAFADYMAHPIDVIDPAGEHPEAVDERQEFPRRMRSAG
jgi:hypothetical protein